VKKLALGWPEEVRWFTFKNAGAAIKNGDFTVFVCEIV
jgi:hypothetical protein